MQDKLYILPTELAVELGQVSINNLPLQLTSLIGREQDATAACALLRRPEVRLVTFTGTGGIGKTRLGLQAAADLLEDFADGVCFVLLASISDPGLVVPTIAQAFELNKTGDRSFLDLLKVFLQDKQLLLLLDNFEQVVLAAPLLTELLSACPQLKLLVTSRAVLHVQGEYEFPVPPLAVPDIAQLPDGEPLVQYAAITLFLQRAQAIKPDFQITKDNARAIAEICVRLDGLPLAIELAAARIKLLPPQVLLERLEHRPQLLTGGTQDMPARQRTLRNTITWSYNLLNVQEQQLFRQLSVFIGGCTLQAAEAVCGTVRESEGAVSILDDIASLLDKSLLHQIEQEDGQPRLLMLETIREYGQECLQMSGEEEATRYAHGAYYMTLAETAEPELIGAQQDVWIGRLEREYNNLRAALHWLLLQKGKKDALEMALRMAGTLWMFWFSEYYYWQEGLDFLERALVESEEVSSPVRAKVLRGVGNLNALVGGHIDRAVALCQESLRLYQQIGDSKGAASAYFHLGIATSKYNWVKAGTYYEESLALSREARDSWYSAWSLGQLARIAMLQGEFSRAHAMLEESRELFKEIGDQRSIAFFIFLQAQVHFLSQDDDAKATLLLEEMIQLNKSMDPNRLSLLALIALHQGDIERARSLTEQCLAIERKAGDTQGIAERLSQLAKIFAVEGKYTRAHALYQESFAIWRSITRDTHSRYEMISSLEGFGSVVAAQGEHTYAARLWGLAQALRETWGTPLPPVERAAYEQAVAMARANQGEALFDAAWAEGRSISLAQVLVAKGQVIIPQPLATETSSVLPAKPAITYPAGLPAREVEVLCLIAQGLTDAQVAEQLVISPRTVNWYLTNIYRKIGVSSRSAATRYAIKHHLV